MWEHNESVNNSKPRKGHSMEPDLVGADFSLPAFKNVRDKFLSFISTKVVGLLRQPSFITWVNQIIFLNIDLMRFKGERLMKGGILPSEYLLHGQHVFTSLNSILTPVPDFTKRELRPKEGTGQCHRKSSTGRI